LALVVLAASCAWLFYDGSSFSRASYAVDIGAIRTAAANIEGSRVRDIQVETLSHSSEPQIFMVAGTSWKHVDLVRVSYRLVFPDRSIIIDTAYDAATAKATRADSYDDAAWTRLQNAMRAAYCVIVTHEHADHIGGLLASPYWREVLPKALITQEQFDDESSSSPVRWPEGSRLQFKPLHYEDYLAIAPGVVLIKAPGHTAGSQMIYVQRADGQEYLFLGDVASMLDNVRLVSIRSHLVTNFLSHDDRAKVVAQTRALHQLAIEQPGITLVPGHDGAVLADLVARKLLMSPFTP
jgi:glyoxylase-like metal-dependent hydrolase (beta-lactamase superfamily II)